jgi:hypothetical protein
MGAGGIPRKSKGSLLGGSRDEGAMVLLPGVFLTIGGAGSLNGGGGPRTTSRPTGVPTGFRRTGQAARDVLTVVKEQSEGYHRSLRPCRH